MIVGVVLIIVGLVFAGAMYKISENALKRLGGPVLVGGRMSTYITISLQELFYMILAGLICASGMIIILKDITG